VKRGEIWTVAGGGDFTRKPRPAAILQDDRFDTDSITLCPFTTDPLDAPLLRVRIEPTPTNGLDASSSLMVDKIMTVRRSRIGARVGELAPEDMVRLERSLLVFLGFA
jgi:mRNA interferase MazF